MKATKEKWTYGAGERVWVGKYKNSQNIPHWHSDCELVFCTRGELDIVVDGAQYRLTKGMGMLIESERLHHIHALTDDTLLLTVIFDYSIIQDFAGELRLKTPVLKNDYDIPTVYSQLLRELKDKRPLYAYRTAAEIYLLNVDIFEREITEQKKSSGKADAKLKALFEQINENYTTYTLDDAARFMGMNASYLSRFFVGKTGVHFNRYLNSIRVEKAVAMLDGDNTVTEVADKCGFGTIRNFNRIFKMLTGYSPSKLPDGFTYLPVADTKSMPANPTLFGCELIESSSDKE